MNKSTVKWNRFVNVYTVGNINSIRSMNCVTVHYISH